MPIKRTALVVAAILALGGLTLRPGVSAQDATPTPSHPLVGLWLADTDSEDSSNPPDTTFLFTPEGGFIQIEAGEVALGTWDATGPTTANVTLVAVETDDDWNLVAIITLRASVEVDAGGDSFTAEYTMEFTMPDGTSTGQAGPGLATGARVHAEAPGPPDITVEELYSGFDDASEATPAS